MLFWLLGGAAALLLLAGVKKPVAATVPEAKAREPEDAPRAKPQLHTPPRRTQPQLPREVFILTNTVRRDPHCGYPPAPQLTWSEALAHSAQLHAEDMARQHYFSHDSLDGRTPSQRMAAAGFTGTLRGENIAEGQTTAQQVIDGWVSSPGHCKNLMNPSYKYLGVGYSAGYWVQNFGA